MIPVRFRFSTNFLESRFWNKHDQTLLEFFKKQTDTVLDFFYPRSLGHFGPVRGLNFSVRSSSNILTPRDSVLILVRVSLFGPYSSFFLLRFHDPNFGSVIQWFGHINFNRPEIRKNSVHGPHQEIRVRNSERQTGPKTERTRLAKKIIRGFIPFIFWWYVDIIDFKSDILINFRNLKDHKD